MIAYFRFSLWSMFTRKCQIYTEEQNQGSERLKNNQSDVSLITLGEKSFCNLFQQGISPQFQTFLPTRNFQTATFLLNQVWHKTNLLFTEVANKFIKHFIFSFFWFSNFLHKLKTRRNWSQRVISKTSNYSILWIKSMKKV